MSYLGIFSKDFWDGIVHEWKKMLNKNLLKIKSDYDIKEIMSDDIKIGNWTNKF